MRAEIRFELGLPWSQVALGRVAYREHHVAEGDEMPSSNEPLKVTPAELHLAADKLDGHGSDFLKAYQAAHERAGQVRWGRGWRA